MGADANQDRGTLYVGRFADLEDALVARVRERRQGRSLAPLTIIVGSSALRTRVGDLLVRRLGAAANVSVVTLATAATAAAAPSGGGPLRQAAPLLRERLVGRLVRARLESGGLRYFGPVSRQPHFAQALAATFEDLREGMVSPQAQWECVPQAKAADLRSLYADYCAELSWVGVSDDAAVFEEAAASLTGSASHTDVIVYGLYDLNEAQAAYVGALLAAGADLFLPQAWAGDGAGPALQAARAAGLSERRLDHAVPVRDADRVAAGVVASRVSTAATEVAGDGSLHVVSVTDERGEVREAVREVLVGLANGAQGAWDCAVVVPHAADVERFAAGLRRAGLPVACHVPDRSVSTRLLLRLLDCLAPPAGKPFSRRAVLDLLSVSVPPAANAVAFGGSWLWADEARQAGIVWGLEQWTDRLRRRRHGLEQRLADLAAGDEDEEPGGRRRRLGQRLAAAAGLEAAAAALAAAFAKAPACSRWSVWADWLGAGLQQTFAPEVTAGAVDAVQRLRSLEAAGEKVSAAEMAAALRRLLADASLSEGRIGRDGVAVLTPLALRGLRFHTVVFAGLAEGGFPARGRPDSILGDADRQRLAESLGVRLPLAEERETESALLLAFAAESAAARLILLSPRMDAASGRSRLPSRLLLRLASAVAGRAVGLDEFLGGAPLQPVWRRVSGDLEAVSPNAVWTDEDECDVAALLTLGASRSQAAGRYLAGVLADESGDRRLAAWQAWQEVSAGAWDGLLGPEAVRLLDTKGLLTSELHATRLEGYITCPFTFLLRDVLGLAAPEDLDEGLEIDPQEFGSLAHEILERAFAAVIARELDAEGALVEVREAHARCCDAAEARGVTGADLAWSVRRETLLEDLLEAVRRDPVFTDGRPRLVEWRFGECYERPVALELAGGRKVRFAGRIDRVDRTSRGARVVDYKTGGGRAEADRIRAGLGVQLPVYRLAVEQADDLLGEEPLDVECVYQMVTRRGSFAAVSLPESAADATALATLVARMVELVEGGVFARSTKGRCDYCEVRYACGASSWTRARKQRDQRLAPLVALQHGDLEQPSSSDEAGES